MLNHFHFFIRVNDSEQFEKGIKNFFISYSKAINKKYNRVGSLFQGRYKVSEIKSDSYYTKIITYIHLNPIAADLVSNLAGYKYSSYNAYLPGKESILNRQEVLEWFGGLNAFIDHHEINLNERQLNKYLKI